MQFGMTVGSSMASAVTKPAFRVCAPLSMTSVRVGWGGGAGLDLRGAIVDDVKTALRLAHVGPKHALAASRMEARFGDASEAAWEKFEIAGRDLFVQQPRP